MLDIKSLQNREGVVLYRYSGIRAYGYAVVVVGQYSLIFFFVDPLLPDW